MRLESLAMLVPVLLAAACIAVFVRLAFAVLRIERNTRK